MKTGLLTTFLELDVEVTYDAHAGSRGARDSLGGKAGAGPALEPDEPAEIEITGVFAVQGDTKVEITTVVSDDAMKAFEQEIELELAEDGQDE